MSLEAVSYEAVSYEAEPRNQYNLLASPVEIELPNGACNFADKRPTPC